MNRIESNSIPSDYLDDLCSRFIINIPADEKKDPIRLFFQIELAFWFYLDFYKTEDANLKHCSIKEFAKHIFRHVPSLTHLLNNVDFHYDQWRSYKISVPTYGAIILNEDMSKVLLVQGFYEKASWGFPKGKVNEAEAPHTCAVREVYEETGCDISALIRPDVYLEAFLHEQLVRLFVVPGIKESTVFVPQTRNEIKKIQWFTINDLPTNKKDPAPLTQILRPSGFFMVMPFVRKLKTWIEARKSGTDHMRKRRQTKSVGDPAYGLTEGYPVNLPNLVNMSPCKNDKRQDHAGSSVQKPKTANNVKGDPKKPIFVDRFVVPVWLSFKLDRKAILRCLDP